MKTSLWFSGPGKRIVSAALSASLLTILLIATPVQAAPTVTISPSAGAAGTVATISGSLFDSYKGDTIYVLFDGEQIDYSPFTVPETGTFEIPFLVPIGKGPGVYRILVTTNPFDSLNIADTWFTVEETAIYLDIVSGPVGTSVTISASGFYAESDVTLFYHNPSPVQVGMITASELGRFDHHYIIPDSVAGTHTITATNVFGNQAAADFQVVPLISLSMDSGGPGETVHTVGTGFGNQTEFTITMGTREIASGFTDEIGHFEFDFYIPTIKANIYDVIALDTDENRDTVKFTVTAGASLNKSTGPVGSSLTVRGDGFKPGGAITITFGGVEAGTATANNNGAFTTTITVPAAGSGSHIVAISDGSTVKEFTFTIESVAPEPPALVSPANGSQTGSRVTFDWNDVTDDSLPVTYRLQVAADASFSSLLLNETDLTQSSYAFAEGLASGNATVTYYWRVNAEDGAWNEGAWSDAWNFFTSPVQAPVLSIAVINEDSEQVVLDWTDTTSPDGPVTYTLEVSGDQTFSAPFIEETGLIVSSYSVTGADYAALEAGTYYWRVKAIDQAANESEWSGTGSFTIEASASSFPSWAIFVIAGIGIIIIIYLAFRMGRRGRYQGE